MSHDFDFIEEHLTSLRALGRSPHTIAHYRYALLGLHEWRGREISDLTRLEARAYVRHLSETFSPGGVKSRLGALRAHFNWLVSEELAEANPFAKVSVKVPETAQLTATDDEVEQMLRRAAEGPSRSVRVRRDVAMLTVLVDTGCRKGELAAVTVDDVDLKSGVISFRESKTRARVVPLSDRAHVALSRYLRTRGTAAGSLWGGEPYSLVRAVVKKHSRGTLTPHSLRRHFAVSWLGRGGSESGLVRICGWSSGAMVATYIRDSADVLAHDEMRRLMAV